MSFSEEGNSDNDYNGLAYNPIYEAEDHIRNAISFNIHLCKKFPNEIQTALFNLQYIIYMDNDNMSNILSKEEYKKKYFPDLP